MTMATQALRSAYSVPRTEQTQTAIQRQAAPKQAAQKPADKSLMQRVLDFIVDVQSRRAEREIARFVRDRGYKFTDEAEREIEQKFLAPGNRP
jgi:type IV secretory pathway TrbF-like protein